MNCPTAYCNNDVDEQPPEENEETQAEFWKRQYFRILEEAEELKKKKRDTARIDIIGQNGNEGEHYGF